MDLPVVHCHHAISFVSQNSPRYGKPRSLCSHAQMRNRVLVFHSLFKSNGTVHQCSDSRRIGPVSLQTKPEWSKVSVDSDPDFAKLMSPRSLIHKRKVYRACLGQKQVHHPQSNDFSMFWTGCNGKAIRMALSMRGA